MLNERAFLAFEKYAWLQALDIMPCVLGNVNAIDAFLMTDDAGLQHFTIVVVGGDAHLAFQYHHGLVFGGMVMHRYLRAWFQHVEKAVALVGKALVKIVVHPQPR